MCGWAAGRPFVWSKSRGRLAEFQLDWIGCGPPVVKNDAVEHLAGFYRTVGRFYNHQAVSPEANAYRWFRRGCNP
jgi:hypothetical protein